MVQSGAIICGKDRPLGHAAARGRANAPQGDGRRDLLSGPIVLPAEQYDPVDNGNNSPQDQVQKRHRRETNLEMRAGPFKGSC